ncbi:hypothetical protein D1007_00756 [Hordeum vulgare]|nr:hypothetical protein D1007_00756 [Hordeum vulgare]
MAEAHGDAGAAAGDVVELQGAVTADEVKDVGGVHGSVGKLATAADVEKEVVVSAPVLPESKVDDGWGKKRKLAFTGFDPYDPEYSDDEEYEYDSREDVYKGNFASFTAKEVGKIKAKGVAPTARSRSGAAPTAPPSQSQRMAASITLCLMQRM